MNAQLPISETRLKEIITKDIKTALLAWYERNGRSFAWRRNPKPYIVLIAEILLKKTTARVVDRFFPVFLEHYPDIYALHEETNSDLQKVLSPLGLSGQRTMQLKNLANVLVESFSGKIPCSKEELLKLPGIGDYTAGAFLSFACGVPEAIVDTNIARLITRMFGIKPSHYEARRSPEIWEKARELVGQDGAASERVNWALLDLAAIICKSQKPLHSKCPVKKWCIYERESHGSLSQQKRVEDSPNVK